MRDVQKSYGGGGEFFELHEFFSLTVPLHKLFLGLFGKHELFFIKFSITQIFFLYFTRAPITFLIGSSLTKGKTSFLQRAQTCFR